MSLKEDFDGFDPVKETQKAHDGAMSNHWDGSTLGPWTLRRDSAAMLMGCRILTDLSAVQKLFSKGTYPSVLQDVLIVLWLLSSSKEKVFEIVKSGEDFAKEALAEVFDWAESLSITRESNAFKEGVKVLAKIVAEKIKTRFESENGSKSESLKKKDSSQRGNSGSRSAQAKQADETKAL